MKKSIIHLAIVSAITLIMIVAPFSAKAASPNWSVTLTASLGVYTSNSTLGVANNATEGFDMAYDAYAPLAPPVGVLSYFYHPSNPSGPPDARRLSTSIIAPDTSMNWTLRVTPYGLDGTMKLSWTAIPGEVNDAYIMDSTGTTILADMKLVAEYSYAAADSVMAVFRVSLFVIPEFPIGAIIALVACFVSYGAFKGLKRLQCPIA